MIKFFKVILKRKTQIEQRCSIQVSYGDRLVGLIEPSFNIT